MQACSLYPFRPDHQRRRAQQKSRKGVELPECLTEKLLIKWEDDEV